ncbi:MAG: hypothetical protein ACPGEF_00480 [Endozoicomonas sp.]
MYSGRYHNYDVSATRTASKRTSSALQENTNSKQNENGPALKRRALHSRALITAPKLEKVISDSPSLKPLSKNTFLLKGLLASAMPASALAQGVAATTTVAPTADALKQVLSFDQAIFGQALKESTECIAFLKVAFNISLTEAQQTSKNKILLCSIAGATFLSAWLGTAGGLALLLGSQLEGSNTELLIKSIEGATKLWAAYQLFKLIRLETQLKQLSNTQNPGSTDSSMNEVTLEAQSGNIREDSLSPLQAKYKEKILTEAPGIYGDLHGVIRYVMVQCLREGGELGVLSAAVLTPYIAAGTSIGIGVGTIALSGCTGILAPIAAYKILKGSVFLAGRLEQKYNHTDWIAKKCDGYLDASGDWIKTMLVFTLLSVGVHEIEEVLSLDVKLWDLKLTSPLLSEKLAPFAVFAALLPFDADPTFWQALVIFFAWSKYAVIPTAKYAYNKFSEIYKNCKSGSVHPAPDNAIANSEVTGVANTPDALYYTTEEV